MQLREEVLMLPTSKTEEVSQNQLQLQLPDTTYIAATRILELQMQTYDTTVHYTTLY